MFLIRQGKRVCISTPAKLNLFLELQRRRADGFHDLETLMVPINLFDSLTVSPASEPSISLTCRWADGLPSSQCAEMPATKENIVTRALEQLREAAKVEQGINVELVKRIPAQAGLGGGSSDAAAALVAANELWRLGWSLEALAEIGAEVGSDVPFFLFDSSAANTSLVRCTGRGEIMEPAAFGGRLYCVVVKPNFGLSTPEVFKNATVPAQPRNSQTAVDCLRRMDLRGLANGMFNRLQLAAAKVSPWIDEIANAMSRFSVWAHQLSGSGTSYFAVCRNWKHARQVAARLRATQLGRIFVVTTLGPRLAH